jgi:hypothetical protein
MLKGEQIIQFRNQLKKYFGKPVSQEKLAILLGGFDEYSGQTICRYETGQITPPDDFEQALSNLKAKLEKSRKTGSPIMIQIYIKKDHLQVA